MCRRGSREMNECDNLNLKVPWLLDEELLEFDPLEYDHLPLVSSLDSRGRDSFEQDLRGLYSI